MGKNLVWVVVGLVVLGLVIAGYFYFLKPKEEGTIETAKTISEAVPEIQTNPGETVPEVNPLDRANPFKYNNPLR